MNKGRKTKSGTHYNYTDRRKAAMRSLQVGTAQAAKEYGVSEASIKGWRKMYGLDKIGEGYGGSMDRYFCQRCKHGSSGTFTGCTYILHTGEKRPHVGGWCLGFEPREGVHQSTVDRYARETAKHEESEEDDMNKIEPFDIDYDIIAKASKHKTGTRYTEREKQRILDVYKNYSETAAVKYFGVNRDTMRYWLGKKIPSNMKKQLAHNTANTSGCRRYWRERREQG